MSRIFLVGDSTVAKFNDVSFFYPRYGYGELLSQYFDVEIFNYALSGRSSKSYLLEENYSIVFDNLKEGDFLFIGFGHNDEKDDDKIRFTRGDLGVEDKGSFKNILYYEYALKAIKKGATPVLLTPVVRLDKSNEYLGNFIHITPFGDYKKAILDLGKEKNIFTIDLTTKTRDLLMSLGYKNSLKEHALTQGIMVDSKLTYNPNSVDNSHMSYLGAYHVAYFIANAINESNLELKKYIKTLEYPSDDVLEINPSYQYKEYITPDFSNYKDSEFFNSHDEFYGTAFGMLDVVPDKDSGYVAKYENNKYIVGCYKANGKLNSTSDGLCHMIKKVDKTKNFIFSAHVVIKETLSLKQSAIGLMLRGDAYLPQETKSEGRINNYIASALLTTDALTYAIVSRIMTTEIVKEPNVIDGFYKKGDILDLRIERLGQVVFVDVTYNGITFKKTFTDFDYASIDKDYIYVSMFATKGTVGEFSDVKFKITGDAKEA